MDSTGILSYTVALTANSKWESLVVGGARLTAETTSRSVPDAGATALLLGLGVIGLVGAKRRFASVA
ncbi:MAG: VPDSG-CTERM sorting domain-containing protein [Lacunisphaera sp.]